MRERHSILINCPRAPAPVIQTTGAGVLSTLNVLSVAFKFKNKLKIFAYFAGNSGANFLAALFSGEARVSRKVGNFELVPYHRYTGSTIGKIILPLRPQ